MGRPREHDASTAVALLEAAERTIQARGMDGLSVRGLADDVGTTTRAVYSLFGSKDGLLVALAARAFELLGAAVRALPESDDPAADLVRAGVEVFRPFTMSHPILFRAGVQRGCVTPELAEPFERARRAALAELEEKLGRLQDAGLLGGRSTRQATRVFHAMCEGLADMELRGGLPRGSEEDIWRDAFGALVTGLRDPNAVTGLRDPNAVTGLRDPAPTGRRRPSRRSGRG